MRSLRWRFLVGSVLWTCGLLMLTHLLSMALVHHLPAMRSWGLGPRWFAAAVGVSAMAAGFALVRRALASVAELRGRLAAVRAGREATVGGSFPVEVQPLVDDLNGLLVHRDETVKRALAKAGDLAHGLKTPLALLAQEAERTAAAGQPEVAAGIAQQVEKMRRQVDYHLAQARAAAAGATLGARTEAAPAMEALVRTLRRLYAERALEIAASGEPGLAVQVQQEDLEEMLGNLLDNACKWTRRRVLLGARQENGAIVFEIDDDGAGLSADDRQRVLRRGVRADQNAPGSGLGLAIAADLAEIYGGSLRLEESPLGGLRAQLELPQAATST